ncbi:unnamed protein product, partial [Mesorhabditis spiculigera]
MLKVTLFLFAVAVTVAARNAVQPVRMTTPEGTLIGGRRNTLRPRGSRQPEIYAHPIEGYRLTTPHDAEIGQDGDNYRHETIGAAEEGEDVRDHTLPTPIPEKPENLHHGPTHPPKGIVQDLADISGEPAERWTHVCKWCVSSSPEKAKSCCGANERLLFCAMFMAVCEHI